MPADLLRDQDWRKEIALAAAGALLGLGLLWFTPPSLFQSMDYVYFYKANFQFLLEALKGGHLPLWNPAIGLGRPYLADLQNAVFYPPLYLICLGKELGVFLLVWLHCLLALLGMRWLGTKLGMAKGASYLAGVTFLGSLAFFGRLAAGQLLYCCGLCYLPLLFAFAVLVEGKWRAPVVAGYALCLALQFLCGHPQVFWFSAIGQGVFIVVRSTGWPRSASFERLRQGLVHFTVALVWCAALVAVAVLPFMELVREGNRQGTSPALAGFGALQWTHLLALTGIQPAGPMLSWERNLFMGLPMVLAGLAGLAQVRDRNVRGLLGLGLAAVFLGFGSNIPGLGWLWQWIPGYSGFRLHVRSAVLVVFALSCAGGLWLSGPHPWVRLRHFRTAFILAQTAMLLAGGFVAKSRYSYAYIMGKEPVFRFEAAMVSSLRNAGLLEDGKPPPRICVPLRLVPANNSMLHHYSHIDAYTSLFLSRPWQFMHRVEGLVPSEVRNSFLSEQIYDNGPFAVPALSVVAGTIGRSEVLLFNTNPAPRAFVVYGAKQVTNYLEAIEQMRGGNDIYRTALVEQPLLEPLPAGDAPAGAPARILKFTPNALLIETEARQPGLLVLGEAWYPGWKAEIGGRVVDTLPANGWMRAVPIPAGRHTVRVFFRQNYLPVGGAISLLGAGALGLGLGQAARARLRERARHTSAMPPT